MLIPNDADSKNAIASNSQQSGQPPVLRKSAQVQREVTRPDSGSHDAPPAYTDPHPNPNPTSMEPTPAIPKAINYLVVERGHQGIKETYAVDPSLTIPPALMPPLAEDESCDDDRKNLRIKNAHGAVYLDLWIVGHARSKDEQKARKAKLHIQQRHGYMTLKMHAPSPAPTYVLTISAQHSPTVLKLPRSFHGPLTITASHSPLKMSDEFAQVTHTFHEIGGKRTMFVGDLGAWTGENWEGDEVEIDVVHSTVKLSFEDEVEPVSKGFFERLFR